MGLEKDARAGRVRVGNIVAKPDNLTPNIDRMSKMFRQGQISANEIHDRYGARGNAVNDATIAMANMKTMQAEQLGPLKLAQQKALLSPELTALQIEKQKAMLSPELTTLQNQVTVGSLEEQIANQSVQKETRQQRDQLLKAGVAQALNEIQGGIPAQSIRQLALQYPSIIKPQYNELGIVQNTDEVRKQIASVKAFQTWVDAHQDMADRVEVKKFEENLPDGNIRTVERLYWKGTQTEVPVATAKAIAAAQSAIPGVINNQAVARKLEDTFGAAGQVTPAVVEDPNDFAPVPPAHAAPVQPQPHIHGDILPPAGTPIQVRVKGEDIVPTAPPATGGLTVGEKAPPVGNKPTEVEARAFAFAKRMRISEEQYQRVIATGIDPTSFAMSFQTGILEQASALKMGIPVLSPLTKTFMESKVSPEAKRLISAMSNWSSAILRQESGAAIKDAERAQYIRAFFPIANDPPDVVADKKVQRRSAERALEAVFARNITPEEYENQISELSGGLSFPAVTSVLTPGSPENKAFNNAGGAALTTSPAAPDKLITLEPGQLPPADAQIIRGPDGIARRRRQPAR